MALSVRESNQAPRPRSALMGKTARRRVNAVIVFVALLIISIIVVVPAAFGVSTSLKATGKEFTYPIQWIPNPAVWSNYLHMVREIPILQFLKNTLTVVFVTLVGDVLSCSLVAYAFARLHFPGRDRLFLLVLSTLMLPYVVTLIPQFVLFRTVGWVNTLLPLIIPAFFGGQPIYIFLLRQFFRGMPSDIEEAARLDGASQLRIWWSIAMPLARPGLVTVAILSMLFHWNDFIAPLVYLNTQNNWTLALAVNLFQATAYTVQYNYMMGFAVVMTAPVIIIFILFQKNLIRGINMTGMGGR